MRDAPWVALGLALLISPSTALAQASGPAVGLDVFLSDDADDTRVERVGLTIDWAWRDPRHYRGLKLERARFSPAGDAPQGANRVFYRFADTSARWEWNGQVGTDGEALLGAASLIRPGPVRTELFAEREVLETRRGLDSGQIVTFAGAAVDVPLGAGNRGQATVLAGLQDFDDGNLRTHLRLNLVSTLSETLGLTAQLRTRAFRNSRPRLGDYFSPREFAEVLPVLQVRRRVAAGWTGSLAAGWGRQRQTGADWRTARLLQAGLTAPSRPGRAYLRATFLYSDTPGAVGDAYGYRQATLQWVQPL